MFNYKLLPKTPPTADKYFMKNNLLTATFTKLGYKNIKKKTASVRYHDPDKNKYYSVTLKHSSSRPKKRLKSLTRSLNFTSAMLKIKEK